MSSLWAVSVLSLLLAIKSIECQSKAMCDFIKPNGNYEGMSVHKEYGPEYRSRYYMTNKRGIKWKFDLSEDHTQLYLLPGQYEDYDQSIVKSFGIFLGAVVPLTPSGTDIIWANCYVNEMNIREVQCIDQDNRNLTVRVLPLTTDFVIFRGQALSASATSYTVILNRVNNSFTYLYSFNRLNTLDVAFLEECGVECPKFQFIDQMENSSILSRLDGVVDFNFGRTNRGFLLLFNIEDRPMYCFQLEGKQLSDDCKSAETLSPAFEECFQEVSKVSTNFTGAENMNTSIGPLYWVLIFELLFVVILQWPHQKSILQNSFFKNKQYFQ